MWIPADLNYGHLDWFFFLLAVLMLGNILVLRWVSEGFFYHDDKSIQQAIHGNDHSTGSVDGSSGVNSHARSVDDGAGAGGRQRKEVEI